MIKKKSTKVDDTAQKLWKKNWKRLSVSGGEKGNLSRKRHGGSKCSLILEQEVIEVYKGTPLA